jgi:hypothetical protein
LPQSEVDGDRWITADPATAADGLELFDTRRPAHKIKLFEKEALAAASGGTYSGVVGGRPGVADAKPARLARRPYIAGACEECAAAHAEHEPKEDRAGGQPQKKFRRRKAGDSCVCRGAEVAREFRDGTGEAKRHKRRHGADSKNRRG